MRQGTRGRWRWTTVDGAEITRRGASRFAGPADLWLPPGTSAAGPGRWRLTLSLGAVHRDVLMDLGDVWRDGREVWRTCSWLTPEEDGDWLPGAACLPPFHGTIGVREVAPGELRLSLEGMYVPPFGLFGRLADRLLLGRLARRSLRELLDGVAGRLGSRVQPPRDASLPRRSAR